MGFARQEYWSGLPSLFLINFMKISTNYSSLSFSSTPSTTCHLLPPYFPYICIQTHTHIYTHVWVYMCTYVCVYTYISTFRCHLFLFIHFFFLLGNIIVTTDFKYVLYFLRSLLKKQFNSFLWKREFLMWRTPPFLPSWSSLVNQDVLTLKKKKKSSCFDSNARSLNYI